MPSNHSDVTAENRVVFFRLGPSHVYNSDHEPVIHQQVFDPSLHMALYLVNTSDQIEMIG